MIKITGPANGYLHLGDPQDDTRSDIQKAEFFECEASSLGEALGCYCQWAGATIRPYEGTLPELPFQLGERKYFWFDGNARWGEALVDVHVVRSEEELCPKQDLSFVLLSGDLVTIGVLAC